MDKSFRTPNASAVLKAHFAKVQENCKAPSLAYGLTFANKKIAQHNSSLSFRIASMSKSFTAAAVLVLRDREKLRLDQPIADFVPELKSLKLPTTDSPQVTVRHLLTMTSGLATDDPWGDRHLDADHDFMQSLFKDGGYFAEAPGTDFVYSNYGYAILGRMISNVAQISFQEFITTNLLQPLELNSTTWTPPSHHATPHRLRDGVAIDEGLPPLADGGFASMGGIWSTVDDLLVWSNFMLSAFPARDGKDDSPLCRASRREMQQISRAMKRDSIPGIPSRGMFGGYGMGLRLFDDTKLGYIVTHSGGLPGYGSNMMWYPDRQVAIVALGNITYAPMFDANFFACEALREEGVLPAPRVRMSSQMQSQAQALVDLLNKWNDTKAREIFADNVELDEPFDRRKKEFDVISNESGPYAIESIAAQNDSCADVLLTSKKKQHALKLWLKLSPQVPPRIQSYGLKKMTD
ncbi:MAG TPA: serine hydrolase domain-containing protein [Drouetiella sp.]